MYTTHPDFDPPKDNDLLWRYFDLARYLDLLIREQLFFANIEHLEDPFEGWGTDAAINGRRDPSGLTVSSWHNNEEENYAMWKIYAQGTAGLAIQTTFARLRDSFHPADKPVWIGKVYYYTQKQNAIATASALHSNEPANPSSDAANPSSKPDARSDEPTDTSHRSANPASEKTSRLKPYLQKKSIYAFEKEVRCCFQPQDPDTPPENEPRFNGIYIPIDLHRLIERIYISPYAPAWFRALISGINKKFGLEKEIIHSDALGPR